MIQVLDRGRFDCDQKNSACVERAVVVRAPETCPKHPRSWICALAAQSRLASPGIRSTTQNPRIDVLGWVSGADNPHTLNLTFVTRSRSLRQTHENRLHSHQLFEDRNRHLPTNNNAKMVRTPVVSSIFHPLGCRFQHTRSNDTNPSPLLLFFPAQTAERTTNNGFSRT